MIKLIFLLLIATLFSSSGHRCPEIVDRDERPDLETYYQSPKGHFFIHYDTSGDNAPNPSDSNNNGIPDFVEEAALAADSSRFILTEISVSLVFLLIIDFLIFFLIYSLTFQKKYIIYPIVTNINKL